MVSGHLEDSLRQEIESYIEGRLSGIKQEIAQMQEELNHSLSRLLERQSEVQLDGSIAASILEHLRAAHEEGIDLAASESARAKASSDMAIVKAAIDDIDEKRSQADILKALVNRAASFAPRVAFFVNKGDQSIGWRARGFQGSVGDEMIRQVSVATAADTIVGSVSRSKRPWSGGPHSHSEDHLILNRMGEDPPQRVVGIPLIVRDRTVAVLYADSAGLDSEAINLEALETLTRVAGMAVELLAARTAAPAKKLAEAEAEAEAPSVADLSLSGYTPAREYAEPVSNEPAPAQATETAEAVEEPSEAPVAEVSEPEFEPEPEPEPETSAFTQPSVAPAFESLHAPASAPEPEPEPAIETVPGVEQPARRRYGMDLELPVEVASEEERRFHQEARRFARLLVSEIKLYNEQKVVEGRSQNDLYERLREYIDRSRDMYDKRVKPEVARKYDYFHNELLNTLAEGDEEKLGAAYPGATVTA